MTLTIVAIASFFTLAYFGKGYLALVAGTFFGFFAWKASLPVGTETAGVALTLAAILVFFGVPFVRRVLSAVVMKLMAKALPTIGETEDIALKAGTVWWEGELFSGAPKWKKLINFNVQELNDEEQAFMDGPVEQLCKKIDDDKIFQDRDLPEDLWNFIKKKKFFGLCIPKEYGGLGFSAGLHSMVVKKISSRSITTAVTVMVPNSLGPAELILHYGTQEQKDHYLPRLAKGLEVPCFALTEPTAGSDAANGQSLGVVCKGKFKGKTVTGIKVNFNKRYITLAPVATVVGLAFRLTDPDGLLGGKEDIGITCALLPRDTKGMEIGNRHDPMGVPFQNGPIRGKDVFIPMEYVIGGEDGVGHGWRMLMECLAVGRSISLPSLSVGAAQFSTRATSAYSVIREQFGLSINKFEGVSERIARITGHAYFMEACRKLTVGAVDAGEKPSVASAISKAYLTEGMRLCINDGMDVQAGAAICRGENNIFSRPYSSIPVGITVEGANILTRSLMIFGQGAMRCHPFLLDEVNAIQNNDAIAFDKALFGHINHITRNKVRSLFLMLTCGIFSPTPVLGKEAKYYRQLNRMSAAFAVIADAGLITLGGALKRKESLSGHYADALSWMYIATATLKRFHDEGRKDEDRVLLDWSMAYALHNAEQAMISVLRNLPNRLVANGVKLITFPFGGKFKVPSDNQVARVTTLISNNEALRDHVTNGIYIPNAKSKGFGAIEDAFLKVKAAAPARKKLDIARRKGQVKKGTVVDMAKKAKADGILSSDEYLTITKAEKARDAVIQVNDFDPKVYKDLK